jgi:hypothetical protein
MVIFRPDFPGDGPRSAPTPIRVLLTTKFDQAFETKPRRLYREALDARHRAWRSAERKLTPSHYRYYNMDQVVGMARAEFDRLT